MINNNKENYCFISPNPFKDYFIVKYNTHDKESKLNIYGRKGNIVYSVKLKQGKNKMKIEIPNLKTGIYFVKISGITFNKLIKVIKI